MKREDVLAMEPGEELDEIVSREVFGVEMVAHVPYSTDISAAWEVVEKLKDKVNVSVYTDDNGKYAAEINFYVMDDYDTAPEAICKAALLAVLEDINLPGEETE